jgi:hypothetical protein
MNGCQVLIRAKRQSNDRFIKTGHLTVKLDDWRYRDDIGLSLKDGLISLGVRRWTNRADFCALVRPPERALAGICVCR